ncbi:hypothetical protein OHA70_23440 [Kribbella sp. NBC_00382]|uniref:hypothetical protein n=1 Tax=Kribbella sp. NBC_00382 TaxID=2975967 RepID=UPI002E1E6604
MIRRSVSAGVATAAGLVCLAAPLSSQATVAAYPTAPFEVRHGNTYAVGTVTFFNRGVTAYTSVRSVDPGDCRFVRVEALNPQGHQIDATAVDESPVVCGEDLPWAVEVPANVAGGAASVRVNLMAYNSVTGAIKFIVSQRVFPS